MQKEGGASRTRLEVALPNFSARMILVTVTYIYFRIWK